MPLLQLKSVSLTGRDCSGRRVKTVVNTRRQILWLAGQAAAQVDCDSINKYPDSAGPCLAGYTCMYVRVCVGDARNDGLYLNPYFDMEHNTGWQKQSVH